jgi:DNA repair exonuclease SbcCD ATPase subunit
MNKLFFAFTALTLCLKTWSQVVADAAMYLQTPNITFKEEIIPFVGGTQNALTFVVVGDETSFQKHFKAWMMKSYGIEAKRSDGYYAYPLATYGDWSKDSLNVYYKIERDADRCKLTLLAANKGSYIKSNNGTDEMTRIQEAMNRQLREYYYTRYDEVIADQQKEYERQQKDVEKTEGKIKKLNDDIVSENNKISELSGKFQALSLERQAADQELKVLNATLQQDKKMQDQVQKELDQQNTLIKDKESIYNVMNGEGTLASKEGKRVTKELAKLRKGHVKLQDRLTDASGKRTKTENAVLKKEELQLKLDSNLNEIAAKKAKHESDVAEAKADLDRLEVVLRDEKSERDKSLQALESLKSGRAGLESW